MKLLRTILSWGPLLFICFALVWSVTSADREANVELSEDLVQKQRLLQRLQNLPKRENKIREALQALNNGLAERSLYRGDANQARTEVQRDVRKIASQAKIQIGTMRPLGARRTDSELNLTAIQLSYTSDHETNIRFLELLEKAEPLLRVQRMSVSVQAASTDTQAASLNVSLEIAGFVLQGEAS